MKIVCLLCDIFFVPEIQKELSNHEVEFIQSYTDQKFDMLILDMDHAESYYLCQKYPEKSICFGSHGNTEEMKRFKDTGCKNVIPKSAFLGKLKEVNNLKN